jgi:DMSO reductase anchor subunit
MNPAWSVILFTTLAGAAQGLFLALFGAELMDIASAELMIVGALLSVLMASAGLAASFFHLGHPLRAWRAAAMWKTSWLSREVIVLPLFIAGTAAWGAAQWLGLEVAPWIGLANAVLALALFVCTAMIYASIRFLQEWATPLTLWNYTLLGCASGATLAAALAAWGQPELAPGLAIAALACTAAGAVTRVLSLRRNATLRPRSTLQTAIGIRHPVIRQHSMGFGGGSFNTREFFHGRSHAFLRSVKWWFLLGAFAVPAALLLLAPSTTGWLLLAFAIQYAGLLGERWFFFAQANHPQNLYYQVVS